jgi:soluble lytic murein transglycosylase-like protein
MSVTKNFMFFANCILCGSLVVVGFRLQSLAQNQRENEKRVERYITEVNVVTHKAARDIMVLSGEAGKKSEQIKIIENSLDPTNTRWAKIKQIRLSVKSVIEEKRYRLCFNTVELTAYASAVFDFSEQYDVPIALILAMTERESAFCPKAKSTVGAVGLIQIMPNTAKEISFDLGIRHYDLYKIRDNVHFGVYYIMKMLDEFSGDVTLAVRAYNCGPTYVHKVEGMQYSGYPAETQEYVKRILGDESFEGYVRYYEKAGL